METRQPNLFDYVTAQRAKRQKAARSIPGATEMKHYGETYDAERDDKRLNGLAVKVFNLMRDGQWRTLREIAEATGGSEGGAHARLREFRRDEYGNHTVEREYVRKGLHRYRLLVRVCPSTPSGASNTDDQPYAQAERESGDSL